MAERLIAWVDLQGRYRTTMPAYAGLMARHGFSEDEALDHAWRRVVEVGKHGILIDHPHYILDVATYRERFKDLCKNNFRYGALPDGPCGNCDARDGAWEMDADGFPTVNMPKARGVHMDKIRVVRNAELVKKDLPSLRALEDGDTDAQATIAAEKQTLRQIPQTFDLTTDNDTPLELEAKWPSELPARE